MRAGSFAEASCAEAAVCRAAATMRFPLFSALCLMPENSIQYIQTQNITPVQDVQDTLRGGSSVFVRVLADKGGGMYLVSLGGNRVSVASRLPLQPGSSFRALVSVQDGKVLLAPAKEPFSPAAVPPDGSPDAGLFALLAAEGFAPDDVTVKLLQFLQQGGFRVDKGLMERARRIAGRFPGREREAAEAAALLLEKGLAPTEAAVRELLALAGAGGALSSGGQDAAPDASPEQEEPSEPLLPIYAGDGALGQEPGLLTLVNHLGTDTGHHWVILPYEWGGGELQLSGVIRVLVNLRGKNTEKILINCKSNSTNYFFVLYFKNESKVKEIRFCTLPPLLTADIRSVEKRLGDLFSSGMNAGNSVPVTYSASALQDGLCSDSELPFLFDGKI
ncbi:MAG TPA: hypothetical protein DDW78_05440 [Treponema sp.]|nr:hypothetical protein [Treponema sp.]